MTGLFFIVLVSLYIWVVYKLLRWVIPVWGKALVVVAALLVPASDAYYGRVELERLCKDEGRLRIYRTVESVDGFFNPYTDGRYLAKYSFKERNRSFADVLAITPDTIKGIQPLLKSWAKR